MVSWATEFRLEGVLRTADLMQNGMARVSTSTMGEAIVRELDKIGGMTPRSPRALVPGA